MTSPQVAEPSAAAPPLVSTLSPWSSTALTTLASQNAAHDNVETISLQDVLRVAPQLPQLCLSDLVTAVLHTNASQVSAAVPAHLEAGFRFNLSRELLQLEPRSGVHVCCPACASGVAFRSEKVGWCEIWE